MLPSERYLYLITFQENTKIGISVNPERRLKQFNLGERAKIIFTKKFPNITKVEKNLHDMFYEKHVSGEWFKLSEDDIEYIKEADFSDLLID